MVTTISRTELLALRLRSQGVAPPGAPAPGVPICGPATVVRRMLAMQAQDFGQATWTIGSRIPGSTLLDVLGALDRGEIVRSWPMRGTLHFVVPQDLRWMLRLTTPRLHQGLRSRFRQLDLDSATFARAEEVANEVLAGGRALPRSEFLHALEASGIRTSGQRGPQLIGWLAQRAVVCWGPSVARQQALVLLDDWAPEQRVLDRDESLREFALRYFAGHGPASVRDLAWWTKLTLADARRGTALASDDLVEVDFDGTPHYLGAEADAPAPVGSSSLHLLGGFDEFILGYQDRSVAVPTRYLDRIVPGENGIFLPTIVSAGRVVGTWRRTVGSSSVVVTAKPFETLSARRVASFARAAREYGSFLGLPVEIAAPAE